MTASPLPSERSRLLARLASGEAADLAIIGGGATGLGLALDASLRGLSVILLEAGDFAKGTSSRATKLVHGGVRYLAQGRLGQVREALHERRALLRNAPHLVAPLPFIMPGYACWETPFYGLGLKAYDLLAAGDRLGATRLLSARDIQARLPGVQASGLSGGVLYWDAQFDDARLALALARTAAARGALVLNYCPVDALVHEDGRVAGLRCHDAETGTAYHVRARAVVNATGVWVDRLRALDAPGTSGAGHLPLVSPSQGAHLVVDQDFLPGGTALLVPRTQDGRVLFAVPWLGKLVLGTTDTPRTDLPLEARPLDHEIEFILSEAGRYLARAPRRSDVRSAWAGLRPLVQDHQRQAGDSGGLSREHHVCVSASGLVSVTGGKWTTYRVMASDVLTQCMRHGLLPALPACRTADFPLVGAFANAQVQRRLDEPPGMAAYGADARWVAGLGSGHEEILPGLSLPMLRFAVRYEYARTVEDVLARRSRLLLLDAALAASVAPRVAEVLEAELGRDPQLDAFLALARQYRLA